MLSPIVFRNGSSIITYIILYGSPINQLERSFASAELTNAIDATTNTFTTGGVPIPLKGNAVLLVNSNSGGQQEGRLFHHLITDLSILQIQIKGYKLVKKNYMRILTSFNKISHFLSQFNYNLGVSIMYQ